MAKTHGIGCADGPLRKQTRAAPAPLKLPRGHFIPRSKTHGFDWKYPPLTSNWLFESRKTCVAQSQLHVSLTLIVLSLITVWCVSSLL